MGKKKGRKDGMSTAEYRKYVKSYQTPCPKESCDGTACYSDLGYGKYHQCHKCGKVFGYEDGRGSSITKQKYDALATRAKSRPAKGAGMSCPAEEAGMAKVTKKGKAKGKSKGAKKAAPAARTPEERVGAKASGLAASLVVTTSLDNAAISKKVLAKFPDAAAGYHSDAKFKSIKFIRNDIVTGDERFDWVKSLKGYKKPAAVAKPKVTAKPKATPKKKAKAKKKTAKK